MKSYKPKMKLKDISMSRKGNKLKKRKLASSRLKW